MPLPPFRPLDVHADDCPYLHGDACRCRPLPVPLWAIFDMDGCLCDDRHRRHIADRAHEETDPGIKDSLYKEYHALCHADPKREAESALLVAWRTSRPHHRVAIVTGRNACFRPETVTYLRENGLISAVDTIYMRADHDRRPAVEVKAEILSNMFIIREKRVAFVMDDDPRLVEMYRSYGLTVFQSFDPIRIGESV